MNKFTVVRGITATNALSSTESHTPPARAAGQVQDARTRLLAEMIQKHDLNQDGTLNTQEQARAEAETGLDLSSIQVEVAQPAAPLGKMVHVHEVAELETPHPTTTTATKEDQLLGPWSKPPVGAVGEAQRRAPDEQTWAHPSDKPAAPHKG